MKPERNEKKSETIKVRVPWSLKRDFLARARREGRPASALFREFMADYVRRPARPKANLTVETAMTAIRKHPRPAFAAVIGAAGVSALLTSTLPAGAAPDLRPFFETLDANGDGAISRDEYQSAAIGVKSDAMIRLKAEDAGPDMFLAFGNVSLAAVHDETVHPAPQNADGVFAAFDSDGDGIISMDEVETALGDAAERAFALLDENGDGALALGEGDGVEALDSNGDGRVSRREFSEALVISHR